MQIAIISDIHGNLEALTKALNVIDEIHVDEIVCLGDLVGYGPDPDDCVKIIQARANIVLMGNHDYAVIDTTSTENFNPVAKQAVFWTQDHLSSDSLEYLKNLPYRHREKEILYVHSTPNDPEKWDYIFNWDDAQEQFPLFDEKLCFVGHSHIPQIFYQDLSVPMTLDLSRDYKYIINVGSIGQPRDGNYQLSFGIFDTEQWRYKPVRADYDVQLTSQKIRDRGLPSFLADRLLKGR
jgi:predicted phosphodiesterase